MHVSNIVHQVSRPLAIFRRKADRRRPCRLLTIIAVGYTGDRSGRQLPVGCHHDGKCLESTSQLRQNVGLHRKTSSDTPGTFSEQYTISGPYVGKQSKMTGPTLKMFVRGKDVWNPATCLLDGVWLSEVDPVHIDRFPPCRKQTENRPEFWSCSSCSWCGRCVFSMDCDCLRLA